MNNADSRRDFLLITGVAAASIITGCGKESEGEDVSTNEDLMREHGVLKRVLIIYDEAANRLKNGIAVDLSLLNRSATLIKTFIEDYHEKLEEDHLFPRFEKAGQLTDLTKVLRLQHQKGRLLTQRILTTTKRQNLSEAERMLLTGDMQAFIRMYSPHEAREDTVLFPALHKLISKHEYDALGEDFEKIEKQRFAGDGFDMAVGQVTAIEKALGIYDLNLFTPNI